MSINRLYETIANGEYIPRQTRYSEEYNLGLLKRVGAAWVHPDVQDARIPHVMLRSGLHSGLFFDMMQFFCQGYFLVFAADQLQMRICEGASLPKWAIGSPMAGLGLAAAFAMNTGCNYGFTEKDGLDKDMKDHLICRFDQIGNDTVMPIEDMTTTGQTPGRSIKAILEKNPQALIGEVGAYLSRCGEKPEALEGRRVISVVSSERLGLDNMIWTSDECPYCQNGSRIVKNVKRCWSAMLANMADPTIELPSYAQFA